MSLFWYIVKSFYYLVLTLMIQIYIPTQAIIDSLYIAVDNYSGKPHLVFYIKASKSAPFICDDYGFFFTAIDKDVENYIFYPFTAELFNRLLAYIKDVEDVNTGLGHFLNYFDRFVNLTDFNFVSYKDLKNNNSKYQKAFWYAISNIFAPRFMGFDIRDFLRDFLSDLSNNPNIMEYIYAVEEIQRPFLFKAKPVLRDVGILIRVQHYISNFAPFFPLLVVLISLILMVLQKI